ncbi:hypothetical protein [Roseateles puraquae]|uniref:Uncharacterized protein n=1 Tax=Roseateles puraquae TaxID=431059 RepID=A0A254N6M2_9BURK|nr:hypothetical protein [Roseateles puraquae]MDG0857289.1 hypothetical protein [Roseateles puraquae]OWR03669.1 hypothetical protein CDO81_14375 [Roseateles puraquae]
MKIADLALRPSRRQLILFGALGLSLAATAWVASREDEAPVLPAPRRSAAAGRPTAAATDWPAPLSAARRAWPALPPQARAAWGDKPSAAPTVVTTETGASTSAEAEAPPPPAFPYQLVGRMTDTRARVVLHGPQRSLVLGVGEVVDGQWRIEAIEPAGLRVQPLPDGPSQFIAFSPS